MNQFTPDVETILAQAVEIAAPAERQTFVEQACAGDAVLQRRVEQLIANHFQAGSFLERPAVAMDLVENDGKETVDITHGPGTVIGPYKLLEQIGEGGMGLVYVAEQLHPISRRVALKIIKPGMDSRQVSARFEAERQALALMDHPHIAKVHDAGTTPEGRPYFVMELVKGTPITDYADTQRLTNRQRLELFLDVCHAVQHAHQKGIIHRDLKPANVMVSVHDVTPVVKVIDFGIAKAIGGRLTDKTVYTAFAQMVGTPMYMSPEQAGLSDLDVDTRSDVYALGVLLYELLTGMTPFDSETLKKAGYDELRRMIREDEPPWPSTRLSTIQQAALSTIAQRRGLEPRRLSQHLRGELDWIVMKALEKDRNRRYESASAFAADIGHYLHDEPVQACPPSAGYRLKKLARRHKRGLAVAVAVLALVAVGSGGIGWVVNDRGVRAKATETEVNRALDESVEWQQRRRVPEALSAARRAKGAMAAGHVSAALRRSTEARVDDLDLLSRLEEARLKGSGAAKDGFFDEELTERRYREIFHEFHLDVEGWPAEEAGKLLCESTVALELAGVLDDWAMRRRNLNPEDEGRWKHLLDVARAVDRDGWRTRLRGALAGKDREAMVTLASSGEALQLMPWTLNVVGEHLRKAGAIKPAEGLLRSAQRQHPDDFWINEDLGLLLRDARRNDEAVPFLTAAVALRPQSPGAHGNLGAVLSGKNDMEGAIAEYRKALDLDPKLAHVHWNLALAMDRKQDVEGAIAEYRKAIDLDPKHATAHNNLGLHLRAKHDLEGAIAEFRKAIDSDPKDATAHSNLGVALHDKQDLEGAMAEFRKAIEINPRYAMAHNNLGEALHKKNDSDGAIAEYRKAIEINPKYATPHYNLGEGLRGKQDLEGAIAEYRVAIACNPNYAKAHAYLGSALRDKGQFAEALTHFRRGQELGAKRERPAFASQDPWSSEQSAQWVKECERLVELDGKLPTILSGKAQPADAGQRAEFAGLCQKKHLYASAARLYHEAITAQPSLVASPEAGHRYDAACAAALAGCGQGKDADQCNDKERARLRRQALDWLRADLAAWRQSLEKKPDKAGPLVHQTMQHWQQDTDLAGVRGPESQMKLPESERPAWQKLWAEVVALGKLAAVESSSSR